MATDELGEEYDEFRTSTGLKDDYDGIITDAFFGKPQSGGERLNLFFKVKADDDEVELRYSIGNDWETYDGGKTVEHPREHYFNNRTAYAEFFVAALACGAKEVLGKRSHALERRGPRDSRLWPGLRFHFDVKTETMNLPVRDEAGQPVRDDKGQIRTQEVVVPRTMPTKFLGTEADQAPKSRKGGTTRTARAEAPTEAVATASDDGLPPFGLEKSQFVKLKAKAKALAHDAWMDWVTDQQEFIENDELIASVGDEDFYVGLKGA
jgi:hypothetical protein